MLCFGFYLEMLLYQQYSCHGHSLEYCSCQIYRSSTLIHHCIWLTNPTKLLSWKFQMFNYLYLRDYSRMCFQFVQSLIQHQNVAEPTVSFLLSRYFLSQKRQKSSCMAFDQLRKLIIPHICHRRQGRRPCKFFLPGVNFYRFNAKNWQFTV